MSEENKNLNEEEVTENSEAVETAEEVTAAEETVENIENTESIEKNEAVTVAPEEGEEDETTETEDVPETEVVNGNNKKTIMGVIIGIAVLVVAAVIVLFVMFGKTWFNPYNKGHVDITGRTVGEVADMMGMEYDDFLEQYGLPSDMPKTTIESAASYMIPLSKYTEMNGITLSDLAGYMGWDESITEETTIGEALDKTKLSLYVGEENLATFKEEFGLGDDVTGETLWGDIRNTVELKQKEEYEAQLKAEEEAAAEDEAETDADTDTEPDADAPADTDADTTDETEEAAVTVE